MLFRLKEALPEGGIAISRLDESLTLPFGTLEDVTRRLLAVPGMERIPAKAEAMLAESGKKSFPEGGIQATSWRGTGCSSRRTSAGRRKGSSPASVRSRCGNPRDTGAVPADHRAGE
jgi:hypothetical protein